MANITNNQLYELRPVADPTKNMAIGSSSHVDGAKAIIYEELYYCNDQKWVAEQVSNGWRLRNMESLKAIVIWWPTAASPFIVGQDIVQWWGDQSGTNAIWTPQKVGDMTVGGVECPVYVFKCTSHPELSLSVSDAIYYGSNQVKLDTTDTSQATQQWILVPTVARDYNNAPPYNMGVVGATEKNAASSISYSVTPTWSVTAEVAARSGMTYLMRYRTRTMDVSGHWTDWTDWTLFQTAPYSRSGQGVTATDALAATIDQYTKLAEIAYQVRTCAPGSGNGNIWDRPWASAATEYSVKLYPKPVVTMSTASWSPDGIAIPASSTYTSRGPTTVFIESVKQNGKELLSDPVSSTLISSGDAIHIPQDALVGIPTNGTGITVEYSVGTDQRTKFSGTASANVALSYDAGSPTITVADTEGFTKTVTVADSDDAKVWVLYDGKIVECPNGVVAYPFGKDYEVFASGTYGSPASQFAWHASYTGTAHGVHAWNWDGGSASLQIREGEPIIVDDSIEAVYESFDLAARPYETVSFAETRHHKFTAEGAVIEGKTESGRADFELVAGIHATYRSPRGDVVPVAILSVSRESHKNWTEINVTMVRESE